MTTIAWDGTTLAADKQSTDGGTAMTVTKIARAKNGCLMATSGDHSTGRELMEWFDAGTKAPYPDPDKKAKLLVVTTHFMWVYEGHRIPAQFEEPFYAIGSGREFAIGAMDAGASAEQAVGIACRRDPHSGLGIDVLDMQAGHGDVPCSTCGRSLRPVEIEHYGSSCERCEGIQMARLEGA